MQFQRNKLEQKDKKDRNQENTESDIGEMFYMEPIGNQVISPMSGLEQSSETNENKINKDQPQHRTIIQTVKMI